MGGGGLHVCSLSVNRLLFWMNVCTAFDNSIFWAWFIWESPNSKVLIYLKKLWWLKKLKITVLCSIYKRQFKRKWEAFSLVNPQTHLESVIILDRNRSYLSELQLRRNVAYTIVCRLSPTKKWAGILASTTLLLMLILNEYIYFFINWTLRMSDNLPERVQILCHAHIICITVLYWKTELSAVKYFAICS